MRRATAYVPADPRRVVATLSDPEELWRKVMKWSLAAFLGTIVLLFLVVLLLG